MAAATPRLEIHSGTIAANARSIVNQCRANGVQVAAVTKVLLAHPALLDGLRDAGVDMLADSRLANLARIRELCPGVPTMLLRAPTQKTASETVRWADYSLNSEVDTITALSVAAQALGVIHNVIIMVDVGDLREGVWPDQLIDLVGKVGGLPNIALAGLGTNLACYGGVLPSVANMSTLVELRDRCREATGYPLDLLSGGNSANLPLLANGELPVGINQLRIGEAIILGRETVGRTPWPGTRQDAVRLVCEVVEVQTKPSVPIGETGQDAFGGHPTFTDVGLRRRAICDVGRQDVDPDALTPTDMGIAILGASSDHLICDVTDANTAIEVGSEIAFWPAYSALLRAATSPFVQVVGLSPGHDSLH